MENASKALMMAGGILLAIIIITTGVYVWQQSANLEKTLENEAEQERIVAFNKEYESFQRQALRGIDVVTVINKIRDNNIKNSENQDFWISWEVRLKQNLSDSENQIILKKGSHTENSSGKIFTQIFNNKDMLKQFKRLYFKCYSLEYSPKTGRVNRIIFEEYLSTEIFGQ